MVTLRIFVKDLTAETLDDHPCFKRSNTETVKMTKDWLRKVYERFGPCVKVAYVENMAVAMIQYAPMDIFPHVTNPEAHESVVVHCVYVTEKEYRGKGIARRLVESLIQDFKKPHPYLNGGRFKKIVVLAGKARPGPAGPVDFFSKVGFTVAKKITEEDVLMQIQLHHDG